MEEQGCLFWVFILFLDYLVVSVGVWVIVLILNALGATIAFTWQLSFGIWIILKILKLIFQRRLSVQGERNLALFCVQGVDKKYLLCYNVGPRPQEAVRSAELTPIWQIFMVVSFFTPYPPESRNATIWPQPMYVLISPSRSVGRDPPAFMLPLPICFIFLLKQNQPRKFQQICQFLSSFHKTSVVDNLPNKRIQSAQQKSTLTFLKFFDII